MLVKEATHLIEYVHIQFKNIEEFIGIDLFCITWLDFISFTLLPHFFRIWPDNWKASIASLIQDLEGFYGDRSISCFHFVEIWSCKQIVQECSNVCKLC